MKLLGLLCENGTSGEAHSGFHSGPEARLKLRFHADCLQLVNQALTERAFRLGEHNKVHC